MDLHARHLERAAVITIAFVQLFERASIEQLARDTGLIKRMRSVRPFELLMAVASSLDRDAIWPTVLRRLKYPLMRASERL